VQTNAVTYVVQRMTSIAALFFFCSLLAYAIARRHETAGLQRYFWFFFSLVSGLLAMVSKENSAMLPVMIAGYEFYFLDSKRFSLKNKYFLACVGASVMLLVIIGALYVGGNPFTRMLGGYAARDFTLMERLLTEPRVVFQYLSLLALPLPSRLNLAYDYQISHALLSPPQTVLALAGVGGLALLVIFLFNRDRLLSFAIFWFLGNLLIESSVVPLEIIFEHRMYLSSAFLFLPLAVICYRMLDARVSVARITIGVLAVILLMLTWQRNNTWSTRENIWADVAAKSPNITRGYMGLYVTYKKQGRNAEAMQALKKAIEVGPDEFRPSFNLAHAYKDEKKYKEALQVLNNMLKKENLRTAPAYHLRASIYLELNNYQMATSDAQQAIKVEPGHYNSQMTLASAYFRTGNFAGARKHFEIARDITPDSLAAHFNLGITLYNMGQYDEAIMSLKQALVILPNNPDIHYNLGMVYGAKGMVREMQEEIALSKKLKKNKGVH
jgi:tetratricopeptide (TPR) repeat protein